MDSVRVAEHRELRGARADRFKAAAEFAEAGRRGTATEVAVGAGVLSADRVHGSLNCLLDEGAAGVRPGVGDGLTGMHVDFISREDRLDTL
ncbi:hypothetical protein ACGFZQ_23235 [Streptomyces sp. NPDC048254]|uniref:hypothetical protein n=1 Tax=Streptomyces sp. NPDC048254 TaxID=3365525 RepID=UPI0037243782